MKEQKKQTEKKHYRICKSILSWDVEKEVNELMNDGWKPFGNLLVATESNAQDGSYHIHYIQAMVKLA